MAPVSWRARATRVLALVVLASLAVLSPAQALRIVNYNITNYPSANGAGRDPHFRNILDSLAADVVVVQEMQSQAGVDQFLANLNSFEPGQWQSARFYNGNDTDNALFFKPAKVDTLGSWAFYPNPADPIRFVTCWRLRPTGYARAELRVYSTHLKSSTGSEARRLGEATGIRDSMNHMPPGTPALLLGDFNVYTSTEPAFGKLLESQADNDGRLYDPLNANGTWNAPGFAPIHTQCPCLSCPAGSGFSGGGLDDRFDMFLPTYDLNDGEGFDLLVATYKPVGNDGLHYNVNINDPPMIPEGQAFANSLWNASDHLPVRIDLQLPAKLSAPASLALGSVIGGGSALISIANAATAPADELDYSLSAPAGFLAPGGAFTRNVGAPPATHSIGTAAGPAGPRSGDLIVNSDDPDATTKPIALTATVLDHASASLDSIDVVVSGSIDFGAHAPGGFEDQLARVHNRGFHAYQARLALNGAVIDGGDGRFTLVEEFAPSLVSGVAKSFGLHFEDAGATPDSEYEATLAFSCADEPLPGAAAQPELVVTLHATVATGVVSTPGTSRPARTALLAPFPNPLARTSTLRFDLAEAGHARLEIFDLTGRRVRTVADRVFAAGGHSFTWDGRLDDGAFADAGLYFVRLSAASTRPQSARLAIVR
jgi:endonuclease/exonuclease/phosphatase family metal-dependent hydrolase